MYQIPLLAADSTEFPPIENALKEPNGLLAMGGDLSASRLLSAYRQGIFPWYNEGQPLLWWSPDPRAVLYPQHIKISRSLRKSMRNRGYHITYDTCFATVVKHCAGERKNQNGTWITKEMQLAYTQLHDLGWAHSVEVWQEDTLVGGLYGISIGKLFFGESMFSKATDASKIALVTLMVHVETHGFPFIDCQLPNPHLMSLGAQEISREKFQKYLSQYLQYPSDLNPWQQTTHPSGAV